jgi:hypothetical protein
MRSIDWSKYVIVFLITAAVFGGAFYISNNLNQKRIREVDSIQDTISLDILSSETQFDLLQEIPCKSIDNSFLSDELNSLASRMSYTENLLGPDNDELVRLKKSYFLLEAKDYLLAKRIGEECNKKPVIILYFYSNESDCDACKREGFVLTQLRDKYPDLRVYSFDYDFDSQIVRTLISIFDIEKDLPALVIDGDVVYGLQKTEELETKFPQIKKLPLSPDFATSTKEQ